MPVMRSNQWIAKTHAYMRSAAANSAPVTFSVSAAVPAPQQYMFGAM